jgi:hypothetical protein
MNQKLANYLRQHRKDGELCHKVGNERYDFVLDIKPLQHLCVRAFGKIVNVSYAKILQAAHFTQDPSAPNDSFPPRTIKERANPQPSTKEASVCAYLDCIWKYWSMEKSTDKRYRIAIGVHEPGDLFNAFTMEANVSCDRHWFMNVWKAHFPLLCCEHDRCCDTCDELDRIIRENEKNNPAMALEKIEEKKLHRKNWTSLKLLCDVLGEQSRLHHLMDGMLVLYVDHWGKHKLIAEKRSLEEYKKIDTGFLLDISFSGIWNETTRTADYVTYTEPFEENSNIILNHLYLYLVAYTSKHSVTNLILIGDSHSTQRSNLCCAFLDYLVRFKKIFGSTGKATMVCWFLPFSVFFFISTSRYSLCPAITTMQAIVRMPRRKQSGTAILCKGRSFVRRRKYAMC